MFDTLAGYMNVEQKHDDITYELCWILVNMTSSENDQVMQYITKENFLIEYLNNLLDHPESKIRENSAW